MKVHGSRETVGGENWTRNLCGTRQKKGWRQQYLSYCGGHEFAPPGWLSGMAFRIKMHLYGGDLYWRVVVQVEMWSQKLHLPDGFCASLCSRMFSEDLNLIFSMRFSGKRFLTVTGSRYSQGISFSKSHWTPSWRRDSINAPLKSANEMPGKAKKGKEKIEITAAISAWIIELVTGE